MKTTLIEVRCPTGPKRLLAKVRSRGERPAVVEGNLIEFSCADCRRALRNSGRPVGHVLHRYNVLGELVETVVTE